MDQNNRNCEETELDLGHYLAVVVKHKKFFLTVFLLILAVGGVAAWFSPKIYTISMTIQPPLSGQSWPSAYEFEAAENLKGLIINGAYNDDLKKNLKMDLDDSLLVFKAVIPSKTNILHISVDRDSKDVESGIMVLKNLCSVISASYAKQVESKIAGITSQIKSKENAIIGVREKADNLQEQIKEVTTRKDKLQEEIKMVSENTKRILAQNEEQLKDPAATKDVSHVLFLFFIQNNASYLYQLNAQLSDLSLLRMKLDLELKNTDPQIKELQMAVDELSMNKELISNIKIIKEPKVSGSAVSNRKQTFALSIIMGLFFGVIVVFLREFCVSNLVKK